MPPKKKESKDKSKKYWFFAIGVFVLIIETIIFASIERVIPAGASENFPWDTMFFLEELIPLTLLVLLLIFFPTIYKRMNS